MRLSAYIRLVYFCIGSLVAFVYLFVVACLFVDQEERQAEAGCPEAATHSGGSSSLSLPLTTLPKLLLFCQRN